MKDLNDWREQIDSLDRDLVALLNARARIVLGLAPVKRERGVPVREPDREEQVLNNIRTSNQGPLSNDALERVYDAVIREMRAMQRQRDG